MPIGLVSTGPTLQTGVSARLGVSGVLAPSFGSGHLNAASTVLSRTPCDRCHSRHTCDGCLTPFAMQLDAMHDRLAHPPSIPTAPHATINVPTGRSTSTAQLATYHAAINAAIQAKETHARTHATLPTDLNERIESESAGWHDPYNHPSYSLTPMLTRAQRGEKPNSSVRALRLERPRASDPEAIRRVEEDRVKASQEGAQVLQAFLAMQAAREAIADRVREARAMQATSSITMPTTAMTSASESPFYMSKFIHRSVDGVSGVERVPFVPAGLTPVAPLLDPLQEAVEASMNFGRPRTPGSIDAARVEALEYVVAHHHHGGSGGVGVGRPLTPETQEREVNKLLDPFASGSDIPNILREREIRVEQREAERKARDEREATQARKLRARDQRRSEFKRRRDADRSASAPLGVPHSPLPLRGFVLRLKSRDLPNSAVVVAAPTPRPMESPNPHLHLDQAYLTREKARGRWAAFKTKEWRPVETEGWIKPSKFDRDYAHENRVARETIARAYAPTNNAAAIAPMVHIDDLHNDMATTTTSRTNISIRVPHLSTVPLAGSNLTPADASAVAAAASYDPPSGSAPAPAPSFSPPVDHPLGAGRPYPLPRSSPSHASKFFHSPGARLLESALTGHSGPAASAPIATNSKEVVDEDLLGTYAKTDIGQMNARTSRTRHWNTQHALKAEAERNTLIRAYQHANPYGRHLASGGAPSSSSHPHPPSHTPVSKMKERISRHAMFEASKAAPPNIAHQTNRNANNTMTTTTTTTTPVVDEKEKEVPRTHGEVGAVPSSGVAITARRREQSRLAAAQLAALERAHRIENDQNDAPTSQSPPPPPAAIFHASHHVDASGEQVDGGAGGESSVASHRAAVADAFERLKLDQSTMHQSLRNNAAPASSRVRTSRTGVARGSQTARVTGAPLIIVRSLLPVAAMTDEDGRRSPSPTFNRPHDDDAFSSLASSSYGSFPLRAALGRKGVMEDQPAADPTAGTGLALARDRKSRTATRIPNRVAPTSPPPSSVGVVADRVVGTSSPTSEAPKSTFRQAWYDIKIQPYGPERAQIIAERQRQLQFDIHKRLHPDQHVEQQQQDDDTHHTDPTSRPLSSGSAASAAQPVMSYADALAALAAESGGGGGDGDGDGGASACVISSWLDAAAMPTEPDQHTAAEHQHAAREEQHTHQHQQLANGDGHGEDGDIDERADGEHTSQSDPSSSPAPAIDLLLDTPVESTHTQ